MAVRPRHRQRPRSRAVHIVADAEDGQTFPATPRASLPVVPLCGLRHKGPPPSRVGSVGPSAVTRPLEGTTDTLRVTVKERLHADRSR